MANIRYTFEKDMNSKAAYQLLYSSYSKYDEDWGSYPHIHHFTEIFYVIDGNGSFLVEEDSFPISSKDLVIVNPNIVHTEISSKKNPLEYIVLGVEGLNFLIYDDREYLTFRLSSIREDLDFYFRTILDEMSDQRRDYARVCQNLLEALILQLTRHTQSPVELLPSQKRINRGCSRAKRYIDANFSENITLDTLAEITHLNKYYFAHMFTEAYGISPMNYLTQKRIFISQELLISTDMRLTEIAQQCGFSSSSYFSQCFRRACDLTPTAYRKQFGPGNS